MKYSIETIKGGCVETIILSDGSTYLKKHVKTDFGSECCDKDFSEQMESDGICPEILEKVYDSFDGFLASDFMSIGELDC
ncbi:hypothetical protein SAMN05443270_3152 [Lacrimispora sphenoides]|uniref:hypothetical protein n=1 Tax=Lacrimispora sphenoides TaxID=29370 RepID=UPI0008B8F351|nr:hypothetical protein [Lacrimispora sphenoides]SEU10081.1 hypothetical protein SAMN05443270_3152 [Lacrimispora sphenoides]